MLHHIFIYPIQTIIELVYYIFERIVRNPGYAIIAVSIFVQIITLPLYSIAEKWQNIERNLQNKMKSKVERIKCVFKGDEQYMILSTFYKQQHYHPIFAMRSTMGLIVQIPFFIAAYSFLSNLEDLNGQAFFIISDLSKPDEILSIAGLTINILPIIMTIINVISGIIYSKGFSLREKIQLFAMPLLFLILLYNSPSALVLYWTLNNVFSLLKNIVIKAQKPLRICYIAAIALIVPSILYTLFFSQMFSGLKIFICLASTAIVLLPLILHIVKKYVFPLFIPLNTNNKERIIIFLTSCMGLFLLAGFFIPSALTASSPQEFSFLEGSSSPLEILLYPLLQALGIFLVWIPCVYFLFSDKIKNMLTVMTFSIFFIALINTFLFIGDYGLISAGLQFNDFIPMVPRIKPLLFDFIWILILITLVILIIKHYRFKVLTTLAIVASSSIFVLGVVNYATTQNGYRELVSILEQSGDLSNTNTQEIQESVEPVFSLSKTEQNVFIIMLDRAVSSFLPYILQEKPEIQRQFEGFTYYPNTASTGWMTLFSAPSLFGGYEYVPGKINERTSESLVSKHNEALSVLPVCFLENGFSSTITDASWANFSWTPDNSIFNAWNINAQNLEGKYTELWKQENNYFAKSSKILQSRFLFFSLFRIAPKSIRGAIYLSGTWGIQNYNRGDHYTNFLNEYAQLTYLNKLTDFSSQEPSFTFFVNNTPHEPIYLEYPEYTPLENISNIGPNTWQNENTHKHYHANIAALKEVGKWFDFLRENDVYNNTKIIVLSDHGYPLANIPNFSQFNDGNFSVGYNPLLLVKDFNSTGEVQTDDSFMTIADLPYLATKDAIDNPKNPFTGNPLDTTEKENGITVYDGNWEPKNHNETSYIFNGAYQVKENVFSPDNWTKVSE